jgi:hypothetical protein
MTCPLLPPTLHLYRPPLLLDCLALTHHSPTQRHHHQLHHAVPDLLAGSGAAVPAARQVAAAAVVISNTLYAALYYEGGQQLLTAHTIAEDPMVPAAGPTLAKPALKLANGLNSSGPADTVKAAAEIVQAASAYGPEQQQVVLVQVAPDGSSAALTLVDVAAWTARSMPLRLSADGAAGSSGGGSLFREAVLLNNGRQLALWADAGEECDGALVVYDLSIGAAAASGKLVKLYAQGLEAAGPGGLGLRLPVHGQVAVSAQTAGSLPSLGRYLTPGKVAGKSVAMAATASGVFAYGWVSGACACAGTGGGDAVAVCDAWLAPATAPQACRCVHQLCVMCTAWPDCVTGIQHAHSHTCCTATAAASHCCRQPLLHSYCCTATAAARHCPSSLSHLH